MKAFWDERYIQNECVYGKEPNAFLKKYLPHLSAGRILFPAEGEGRNAIFAAELGYDVYAYDFSEVAMKKALQLSAEKSVTIQYDLFSHETANYPDSFFDIIALIYTHTPSRELLHKKVIRWLKPKGTIILEGFSEKQCNYQSGGPKDVHLLFSINKIQKDFSKCHIQLLEETEVYLNEGAFHNGLASVIRAIIKK